MLESMMKQMAEGRFLTPKQRRWGERRSSRVGQAHHRNGAKGRTQVTHEELREAAARVCDKIAADLFASERAFRDKQNWREALRAVYKGSSALDCGAAIRAIPLPAPSPVAPGASDDAAVYVSENWREAIRDLDKQKSPGAPVVDRRAEG